MREIRFKFYDIIRKRLMDVVDINWEKKLVGTVYGGQYWVSYMETGYLVQYSGYTDRLGAGIYDGYILKEYWEGGEGYTLNEVVFKEKEDDFIQTPGWYVDFIRAYTNDGKPIDVSEGRFSRFLPLSWVIDDSDVVGNIYEFPELLKDIQRDHFYR